MIMLKHETRTIINNPCTRAPPIQDRHFLYLQATQSLYNVTILSPKLRMFRTYTLVRFTSTYMLEVFRTMKFRVVTKRAWCAAWSS